MYTRLSNQHLIVCFHSVFNSATWSTLESPHYCTLSALLSQRITRASFCSLYVSHLFIYRCLALHVLRAILCLVLSVLPAVLHLASLRAALCLVPLRAALCLVPRLSTHQFGRLPCIWLTQLTLIEGDEGAVAIRRADRQSPPRWWPANTVTHSQRRLLQRVYWHIARGISSKHHVGKQLQIRILTHSVAKWIRKKIYIT